MDETALGGAAASRRTIIGLDLIRFLAAVMVVVYHLGHRAWAPPIKVSTIRQMFPNSPAFPELEPVAWLGWVGVEIFFVLSGFVIANSAERSTPLAFLRNRIVRLGPAIVTCATITAAVLLAVRGVESRVIANYVRTLALPAFPRGPWIDSVYWTLIVEFSFYTLVLLLLVFRRFHRIEWVACALGLGSSGLWFAHALFGVADGFLNNWIANITLARHGCFFAAGVLLWLLLYKRVTPFRLAVLAICLSAGAVEIGDLGGEKAAIIGRDLTIAGVQALFLLGVAAIVVSTVFDRRIRAIAGRAAAAFPWLGLTTYPLYLVHNVVGVTTLNALADVGVHRHAAILAAGSLMVLLAWAITRTAEPALASVVRGAFSWAGGRWADLRPGERGLETK